MKNCFGLVTLALLTVSAAASGNAQSGCQNGIVRLPAGINGSVTICTAVAAQAPDLTRQFAELRTAMSSEQAQLAELTRLVTAINQVGTPLGTKRQAEMLTNIVARLGNAKTVTRAQLQQRASTLSGHFEDVSTQVSSAQADPAQAAKMKAAIAGETGDAIARLDFDTVANQLSDIQATVHSVDERTKHIAGTLDAIQAAQQQNQVAGQQAMQNLQTSLLANPSQFLIVRFSGFGQPGGPGKLIISMGHASSSAATIGESLSDAKMQVVFSQGGGQPWTVTPPIARFIGGNAMLTTDVNRLGDHAIVCISAVDPRTKERRRWRQAFVVSAQTAMLPAGMAANPAMAAGMARFAQLSFQDDSEPTLTPDTDAPCQ